MAQNNPFSEVFKSFSDFVPAFDYSVAVNSGRRNAETVAAASQVIAEGAQAIVRRQTEIFQSNIERSMQLLKEITASADPRESAAKQADFAKEAFERTLADSREIFELASKSNTEAYEMLGKRVTDSVAEFSSKPKKAS